MVRIKAAELAGPALDWAVWMVERGEPGYPCKTYKHIYMGDGKYWSPSTDWSQGGPLIEKHRINTIRCNDLYFPKGNEHGDFYEPYWKATIDGGTDAGIPLYKTYGPTHLIAAMRCLVSSKLGDFINIPEALKEMM